MMMVACLCVCPDLILVQLLPSNTFTSHSSFIGFSHRLAISFYLSRSTRENLGTGRGKEGGSIDTDEGFVPRLRCKVLNETLGKIFGLNPRAVISTKEIK